MAGASRYTANPVMRYDDWWKSASWLFGRTTGGAMNAYLSCEGFGDKAFGQQMLVSNELDGFWPFTPIGVVSNSAGSRGRLGTAYDLWYGSTAIGDGDTYPADTSRQFAQFGHFIFPWDGSAPQTA